VKSNNYLKHSYKSTKAKLRGGYLGIEADELDNLLEGPTSTVAVHLKSGEFVVPPADKILPGTTMLKVLAFLEQGGGGDSVTHISRRDIKISEIHKEAAEAFHLAGEECIPILEWDNHVIADGVGTLGKKIIGFLN